MHVGLDFVFFPVVFVGRSTTEKVTRWCSTECGGGNVFDVKTTTKIEHWQRLFLQLEFCRAVARSLSQY